ncbi:hypothetical protein SISNIDRAFT_462467 [Sistotremastrum niveocremeum HHB9708]|uniref:Transcriptional adapter 2 n=2 Tax=Sistotremastraceae TaxID=3402574 RepID=A0A165A6L2_9AGAM|nr:hypothetical protein SISNIDRAFT_462467 [Sistotremastrum niveocremeum HHB9708]KZT43523.1 hypothetical protein SISSUDRAFT_1029698 [Sistotremastrum suecicum HHB10207 ss-3]
MTVTHRKRTAPPTPLDETAVNEPGVQITCDSCGCDLTHSIRIKCAEPECGPPEGVDLCPNCFCNGKEFNNHKRTHPYRVVEVHSEPIFSEDWGADENSAKEYVRELLLIEGALLQGLGNWAAVAEHIGTRTKEEVEQHYTSVYIDSPNWPLPLMDKEFVVDPQEFQQRKRRRIESIPAATAAAIPKPAPTSVPGVHEVATFLPGRLEFEHEVDNDAEDLVKDLEFGLVYQYGGDVIVEDENDLDVKARVQDSLEQTPAPTLEAEKNTPPGENGQSDNADEEPHVPLPVESDESIEFKLTLLEMYHQRVEKRLHAKAFIFDRGLLEYKKMQALEKKRSREEKDIAHRFRPFAKLQTAEDYETFVDGILYESILRKRIAELQVYRKMGITTLSDAEKYDVDFAKRAQAKLAVTREYSFTDRRGTATGRGSSYVAESDGRKSRDRDTTPHIGNGIVNPSNRRAVPAPLNLANSPSISLLSPAEQTLCSQLRILPKPYLAVKEILISAYIKSNGTLRKREARELVKVDVNKTARIWDFFSQAGWFKLPVANSQAEDLTDAGKSMSSLTPATKDPNPANASANQDSVTSIKSEEDVSPFSASYQQGNPINSAASVESTSSATTLVNSHMST